MVKESTNPMILLLEQLESKEGKDRDRLKRDIVSIYDGRIKAAYGGQGTKVH